MTVQSIKTWEKPFFNNRIHACPMSGHSVSFQLVNEFGDGRPYAGIAWLRTQLELAGTWGWKEPEQLHFFVTKSLKAPEYHLPKSWFPHNAETPKAHFERIHEESLYWQGEGSV